MGQAPNLPVLLLLQGVGEDPRIREGTLNK